MHIRCRTEIFKQILYSFQVHFCIAGKCYFISKPITNSPQIVILAILLQKFADSYPNPGYVSNFCKVCGLILHCYVAMLSQTCLLCGYTPSVICNSLQH